MIKIFRTWRYCEAQGGKKLSDKVAFCAEIWTPEFVFLTPFYKHLSRKIVPWEVVGPNTESDH